MHVLDVTVSFSHHGKTGLWKAESKELPGLMVFDKDREKLSSEIPDLIKGLIEAEGNRVISVESIDQDECDWNTPNLARTRVALEAA